MLNAAVRNIPARQRNMQVLFEHSWHFLSSDQQRVLAHLAIFRGGFTLEAALSVAKANPADLEGLVDKSLLRCVEGRYQMHDLLRRFSLEKLQDQQQLETSYNAHTLYFREWVHILFTSDDVGNAFYPELDNLRAALGWSLKQEDALSLIEISGSMLYHWINHGNVHEGIDWINRGLALCDETMPPVQRAKASTVLGILHWSQSDFPKAQTYLEEGAALYRSLAMHQGLNQALNYLGYVALNLGDLSQARRHFEDILAIARQDNSEDALIVALCNLGMIAGEMNEINTAQQYLEEALKHARALKLQGNVAVILNNLGVMAQQQENFAQAKLYYEEASALAYAQDLKPQQAMGAVNLGELAQIAGDYQTAITYFQNALQILYMLGDKLTCMATIEYIAFWAIDTQHVEQATVLLGALQALREALQTPLAPRQQEHYEQSVAKLLTHPDYQVAHWQYGQTLTFEALVEVTTGYQDMARG